MKLSVISSLFHKKYYKEVIRMIDQQQKNQKKSIKLNPKVLYYQALSYSNLHKVDQAINILGKVISANLGISYNFQCYVLRGYLYTTQKDYRNAMLTLRTLVDMGVESSMVYGALGHIAFQLKQKEESLRFLEKSVKIDGNNINALNSLGYVLAEYDIDIERALKYIERVIQQYPKNPIYLDTYGYILYKQGAYADAHKILTMAYRLKSHRIIKEHLQLIEKTQKHKKVILR